MATLDDSQQSSAHGLPSSRRRLLKAAGSAVVLIPTVSLFGCSGEESAGTAASKAVEDAKAGAAAAADAVESAANAAAETAESAMDSAADAMQATADKAADAVEGAADSVADAAQGAMDSAKDAAEGAMDSAQAAVQSAADGLAKLEESDPIAKALAYVEDASKVDTAAQPRFAAGQNCSNCAQYSNDQGGWGACAIFPGKQVAAAGWCAGYIAAS